MTTEPTDTPDPAPARGARHWLDTRFRTPTAVYGLIVYTAFILIGDDHEDDVWDLLLTAASTLLVFFLAHVFAHTLTSREGRTRDAVVRSARHASGMLYASIPTTIVLVAAALDDASVHDAVWFSMLVAVVTLGILGYAAYAKPGRHIGIRILAALGTAALGFVVILLEYAFH